MKMPGEVGRECNSTLMHKKKVKEGLQRIVEKAQRTGGADITMAWREVASYPEILTTLALKAMHFYCKWIKECLRVRHSHMKN